jgi:hypothetical protein
MRRLCVLGAVALLSVMLGSSPASAKSKPPPADESAQGACEQVREMQVNQQYGLDPSTTDYSLLIGLLKESRSKGASKLYTELFKAPTEAAQDSVRSDISRWCLNTLQIRCSAFACVDGNRVKTIPKRS